MKATQLARVFLLLIPFLFIPIFFFTSSNSFKEELSKAHLASVCGRIPDEKDILIDNVVWQALETREGFVKIYSAHLDTRFNESVVRITAAGPKITLLKEVRMFCQLWFEDDLKNPYVVPVLNLNALRAEGLYTVHLSFLSLNVLFP